MSTSITYKLDLDLAFHRIKKDFSERSFIRHPYEFQLIELNKKSWFNEILSDISNDSYKNGDLYICNVPKGKGAIRPGGHLNFNDRLIFTALIGSCYAKIQGALEWSQGKIDFSYILRKNPKRTDWFKNRFDGWNEFRKQSLNLINGKYNFLVVADIAGYYENIDLFTLTSDLNQLNIDKNLIKFLLENLYRWSNQQVRGRSLPQGLSASDILAKLYLNNIDTSLFDSGITHLRYVDDFRIFTTTENEAKINLIYLTEQLRKKGLLLQTAKLRILNKANSITYIKGITPILNGIREEIFEEFRDNISFSNSYLSIAAVDEFVKNNAETIEYDVIRDAYKKEIMNRNVEEFDKTLFHFLMNRLKFNKDKFAVDHVISLLKARPEETQYIFNYLKAVDALSIVESTVVAFIKSPDSVYNYQVYLILEAYDNTDLTLSVKLLSLIRNKLFKQNIPIYLRTICRKILSERGSLADVNSIKSSYSTTSDELEKCEIIFSIIRLEKQVRNSFLSQVSQDSDLIKRASQIVKGFSK